MCSGVFIQWVPRRFGRYVYSYSAWLLHKPTVEKSVVNHTPGQWWWHRVIIGPYQTATRTSSANSVNQSGDALKLVVTWCKTAISKKHPHSAYRREKNQSWVLRYDFSFSVQWRNLLISCDFDANVYVSFNAGAHLERSELQAGEVNTFMSPGSIARNIWNKTNASDTWLTLINDNKWI